MATTSKIDFSEAAQKCILETTQGWGSAQCTSLRRRSGWRARRQKRESGRRCLLHCGWKRESCCRRLRSYPQWISVQGQGGSEQGTRPQWESLLSERGVQHTTHVGGGEGVIGVVESLARRRVPVVGGRRAHRCGVIGTCGQTPEASYTRE
jgi:hypothetical protein